MYLSSVRGLAEELVHSINADIEKFKLEKREKSYISNLLIYTLSHAIDIRSFIFDEQFSYLGKPVDKIQNIIDNSIDYFQLIFSGELFPNIPWEMLGVDLKKSVFDFIKEKITKNVLSRDNYNEFIQAFKKGYDLDAVLKIVRKRVSYDPEKRAELRSVLEYLTFVNRNYFEEEELDNLQKSLNIRLNKLKSYNFEYFMRHFFILRSESILLSEDYNSTRYFFPGPMIKELKNMILEIDSDVKEGDAVREEVKLSPVQIDQIKKNQNDIQKLKSKN